MDKAQILELFHIFDKNCDGFITNVELINGFKEYCVSRSLPELNYNQIMQVFREMDIYSHHKIALKEFEFYFSTRSSIDEVYNSFSIVATSTSSFRQSLGRRKSDVDSLMANADTEVDEKDRVRAIFDAIDANHDGDISRVEIIKAFENQTTSNTQYEHIMKVFNAIDDDESGYISRKEFEEYLLNNDLSKLFASQLNISFENKRKSNRFTAKTSHSTYSSPSVSIDENNTITELQKRINELELEKLESDEKISKLIEENKSLKNDLIEMNQKPEQASVNNKPTNIQFLTEGYVIVEECVDIETSATVANDSQIQTEELDVLSTTSTSLLINHSTSSHHHSPSHSQGVVEAGSEGISVSMAFNPITGISVFDGTELNKVDDIDEVLSMCSTESEKIELLKSRCNDSRDRNIMECKALNGVILRLMERSDEDIDDLVKEIKAMRRNAAVTEALQTAVEPPQRRPSFFQRRKK